MAYLALILVAGLVSFSSCTLDDTFRSGLRYFSRNIFHELVNSHPNENIAFSTFSAQTSLAMVRMGAEGETAAEIDQAMGFNGKSSEYMAENYYNLLSHYENSNQVKLANKVYVMDKYELNENYKKILEDKFFSSAENINFSQKSEAADTINQWIDMKTNHLIKDLIEPKVLSSHTRLVLINALYFKGEWLKPFLPSKTINADFHLDQSKSVTVPMMNVKDNFEFGRFDEIKADAIRMPYKDSDLSMLIFLPQEGVTLSSVLEKMKDYNLDSFTQKMQQMVLNVYVPRFKADHTTDLKEVFEKLHITHLFRDANLSKALKSSEPLEVSEAIQKVFIEVNEKGTESAAASAFAENARIMTPRFIADHPFHYVILNTENVVLFQGNVVNPLV